MQIELELLAEVARGAYDLQSFSAPEIEEARAVIDRHSDLVPGLADASIVVLSRRFRTVDLLTLDERHFRTLTGFEGRAFRLLPADR